MKTFIYALIDPITTHIKYIGKSDNPKNRFLRHINDTHKNRSHKNSWLKYLLSMNLHPELFILDEIPKTEWQFWEQHYISLYKSYGYKLTNMTIGGESGNINKESIIKMVQTRIKNNSYKKTEDQKQKMSIKYIGKNNPFFNKKHSQSSKDKIGKSAKGRCSKWCVEINTNGNIKLWDEMSKAAKYYNINISTISKCCKGNYRNKTAVGKKWEYVNNTGIWDICPICNGTGLDSNHIVFNDKPPKCPTCNGKRIINTLTGKPPIDDRVEKLPSNINEITYWGGLDKKYDINNKKPILRGCKNKQCFCTGKCKEIVGYEEDYKKDSLSASDFAKLFYGTFEGY